MSREFLCQSSHIPYRSVSRCILCPAVLIVPLPDEIHHLRTHSSSISSSSRAAPRKKRLGLSDIKTWRIGGCVAADPRAIKRHQRTSSLVRQPSNERIGQQSSCGRFTSLNGHVGSSSSSQKAASGFTFRWPRGAADQHHHHRGE